MKTYDCNTPIKHGGVIHKQTIELSAEDAKPLLAEGLIVEQKKGAAKKSDSKSGDQTGADDA